MRPLELSASFGRKFVPLPTSRSPCLLISPPKPSSPSKTRGCLTSCENPFSSRPPRPRCCESYRVRRANSPQSFRLCWRMLPDFATRFETLPRGRVGQGSLDGDLQPIDDVVGCPLCRIQAVPEGDAKSRHARFDHRWRVRGPERRPERQRREHRHADPGDYPSRILFADENETPTDSAGDDEALGPAKERSPEEQDGHRDRG